MKRFAPLLALMLCLSLLGLPLLAATAPAKPAKTEKTPGLEIAVLLTQVTGVAISPLLGVSCIGIYRYFQASTPEEKAALPWFAHPSFWAVALLLVGSVAAKDTLGATLPPGWKKPLDVFIPRDANPRVVLSLERVALPIVGPDLRDALVGLFRQGEAALQYHVVAMALGVGQDRAQHLKLDELADFIPPDGKPRLKHEFADQRA